jgi:sigma-B regulation protein RsbU (phosphoserine phosphatase)
MVLCVVSLVTAITFINKGFPGFLVYPFPNVGSFGSRDWPGYEAGLKFMDQIVSMDGEPVRNGRQVINWTSQKANGTPVHYGIESKGTTREVTIPVHTFGIKDFLIVFVVPYIFGLAVYTVGFIVYVLKPNIHSSWVFLIFCFSLGTYVGTGFEIQSSYHLVYIHYLIIPLVPAVGFHLFSIFPDRKKVLNRHPLLEYAIYIPAALIAAAYLLFLLTYQDGDAGWWIPHPKVTTPVNRIFFLACALSSVVFLVYSVMKAVEPVARQRARVILFGIAVAFLPAVTIHAVVTFLKVSIPWNLMVFLVFFFPASIAYSIVRHNLFDADIIIRRTVGYAVVTVIVVGAYAGVSLALNVMIGKYQLADSQIFPILFTLCVILVFNPLRDRIQALVDHMFFRKEYDYAGILDKVSRAMTSLLELQLVLKRLTQTFIEDMFISTSSVMLLSPEGAEYKVYLAEGEKDKDVEKVSFRRDQPLMRIIEQEKRELTKYDMIEDPKYKAVSQSCTSDFDAIHASLMVPLVYQDQLIGLLNLGEKKSGKPYKREDIDLLRTLAQQGAVAIENARLFKENLEKQRMEDELNIARDLQMSMLPACCPQVPGFGIAATSIPAREVGGDFFDFIEIEEGKLGLVVGDVTGKSVSGALVMSASRSVFRMLSEEKFAVGDIMIRANKRIKKDIKSGMFVALLYAVLNSKDRVLSFCSAGQTHPMYFSSETGRTKLLDTKGDNFPLGILEQVDYKETQIALKPGDRVIFYTDGIVEAMNEREEIFGFDRLLDVLQSAGPISADDLLREILDKVKLFAGSAPQHDDLTLIVVSVE